LNLDERVFMFPEKHRVISSQQVAKKDNLYVTAWTTTDAETD